MKYLVICPGLSSPWYQKYIPSYSLLKEQAVFRGYSPLLVVYPGQISEDGSTEGLLSPAKAVEKIMQLIQQLEKRKVTYRILGISFGCCIALTSVASQNSIMHLEKVITWGAIPHWYFWTSFGCGRHTEDLGLGSGTAFINDSMRFYTEITPFEYLVRESSMPIHVSYGSNDSHVPVEYINYLQRVSKNSLNQNHTFTLVQGCGHNVTNEDKNWQRYINTVFL